MTFWEYTTLSLEVIRHDPSQPMTKDVLNEYGQKGWELVAVDQGRAYFKRPYVLGGNTR